MTPTVTFGGDMGGVLVLGFVAGSCESGKRGDGEGGVSSRQRTGFFL